MSIDDKIFKEVDDAKVLNPNDFCHFGWEGVGPFAFYRYACAYYDSACALYNDIKSTQSNDLIDGYGITMCFAYRHFVELYLKHIYIKFVCRSEEDYKRFLNIGHNVVELWNESKPTLKAFKDRVGTSVSLGIVEHYIKEISQFDVNSMSMRYPIDKNLAPLQPQRHLDIQNLRDRMEELYNAFGKMVWDFDNQITVNIPQNEIDDFKTKYQELLPSVHKFLAEIEQFVDRSTEPIEFKPLELGAHMHKNVIPISLYDNYTDDEVMLFDVLYYAGRAIRGREVRLPIDVEEKRNDILKLCVLQMKRDHFVFGEPKNDAVNIYYKGASGVYDNIKFMIDELSIASTK